MIRNMMILLFMLFIFSSLSFCMGNKPANTEDVQEEIDISKNSSLEPYILIVPDMKDHEGAEDKVDEKELQGEYDQVY